MLKARGTIKVDEERHRIVVDVSPDFADLYGWFITREYWIKLQKPLHDAHITIVGKKYHDAVDWQRAIYYDGEEIEFEYDPYVIQGGYTKGFIMFYLKVFSKDIDKMKGDIKVVDNDGYKGLHITVFTSKGHGPKPWWPETITLKN